MKRFFAFTLAETLIVMGIIGIVSALTLPNLNASTGEKEKVAKVKKIYQNLTDAFDRAQAVYGPFDEWFTSNTFGEAEHTRCFERITEFMKVSKTCNNNDAKNCSSTGNIKGLNEMGAGYGINDYYPTAILADGTTISIMEGLIGILVDIDGKNKGNFKMGVDVFDFKISNNTITPSLTTTYPSQCFSTGLGCSKWVIDNDNMEYLKAGSDGKCKNNSSRTLNETVITCK